MLHADLGETLGVERFLMNLIEPESMSRHDDVVISWPLLLRQR